MKSKVTYQVDTQLAKEFREAVENGAATTISEFVQEALRERLKELRRERSRRSVREAASDPLFIENVRETASAYGTTVDDGLG